MNPFAESKKWWTLFSQTAETSSTEKLYMWGFIISNNKYSYYLKVISPLTQQMDQLQYDFDFKGSNTDMFTAFVNVNDTKSRCIEDLTTCNGT